MLVNRCIARGHLGVQALACPARNSFSVLSNCGVGRVYCRYIGRKPSASTAAGDKTIHKRELYKLMRDAFYVLAAQVEE